MEIIKCIRLKNMPHDRWDSSAWQFVHATGNQVQLEDGTWYIEYEDDDFIYSENCVYEEEDDYDDED